MYKTHKLLEVRPEDIATSELEVAEVVLPDGKVIEVLAGRVAITVDDVYEDFDVLYNEALGRFMAVVPNEKVATFCAVFGW